MAFDWNEINTQHLRDMWEKGLTARQIAERIGCESRNAVIGKASRLGLTGRDSPIKKGVGAKASAGQRARYQRRDPSRPKAAPSARPPKQYASQQTWSLKHRAPSDPTLALPETAPPMTSKPRAHVPFIPSPLALVEKPAPTGRAEFRVLAGSRRCMWIEGEVRKHWADTAPTCGAETSPGCPYCEAHRQRATVRRTAEPMEAACAPAA